MITIDYNLRAEELAEGLKHLRSFETQAKNAAQTAAARSAQARRGWLGWVMFIGLAVVLFIVLQQRRPVAVPGGAPLPPEKPVVPASWLAVGTFVGGVVVFGIGVTILCRARPVVPARWNSSKSSFDAGGLTFISGARREWMPWSSFHSFVETDTLFIVREMQGRGRIYPKRLFADESAVQEIRGILSEALSTPPSWTVQSAGGFPVIVAGQSDAAVVENRLSAERNEPCEMQLSFAPDPSDYEKVGRAIARLPGLPAAKLWRPQRNWREHVGFIGFFIMLGGSAIGFGGALYLVVSGASGWMIPMAISALFCFALLSAVITTLSPRGRGKLMRRNFESHPLHSHPVVVIINPAGIDYRGALNSTWLGWGDVVGVGQTQDVLVVMDARGEGMVVPMRAFENAEAAERFKSLVRERARVSPRSVSS